jgi:hypothetical protein
MIDANIDPPQVVGHVVDTIRGYLAQAGNGKVMDADRFRRTAWLPLFSCILEVSDQFLFLRIDRDYRLASCLRRLHLRIEVLKLRIPIGMRSSFLLLTVSLQAIPQLVQQLGYQLPTDGMTLFLQFAGQLANTLTGPTQRRFRVPTASGFNQSLQIRQQGRILIHGSFASAAGYVHSERAPDFQNVP